MLTTQFILEAKNFILSNKSVIPDEMFYLETQGSAMGTMFAPTDAILAGGYHEIKPYITIKKIHFPIL